MSDNDYAKIIAKNLKRIAAEHEKTQADISRDLHINHSTVSTWFIGTRIPRMDKVDMLCNYFNVNRAEIMEENPVMHRASVSNDEQLLLSLFRSMSSENRTELLNYAQYKADRQKQTAGKVG